MKREHADLVKYTILRSENEEVPLPSNFASTLFTVAAFDNFDNADRNSLSGTKHAHDTAITLFQEVPVNEVSKPDKTSVDLSRVKSLSKLPCQDISPFNSARTLTLPETFTVDEELYSSEQVLYNRECKEFVVDCAQNICLDPSSLVLPSWAGIQALLSQSEVPAMQVGFLPFILNSVTEHATVYTAMLNFLKIAKQLNQEALPIFLR